MEFYSLTKRNLIHSVSGVIYEMAPGHQPRNFDKIINHIVKWCDENIGSKYLLRLSKEEVIKTIKSILDSCEEYKQLNISQKLWDKGVRDCEDERNSGFCAVFVGHNEKGEVCSITESVEYGDFIDLGASTRNIINDFCWHNENEKDCFLCENAKNYGSMEPSDCFNCNTCILNPAYKCNYKTHPEALIPQNQKQNKNE